MTLTPEQKDWNDLARSKPVTALVELAKKDPQEYLRTISTAAWLVKAHALFVFDCVMIVATVCAFGALLSWMYGQ